MHLLNSRMNLNFFCKYLFHSVANRFASDYGMMRLSIGEAVRFVLTQQPKTELAKLINAQIRKGIPLPDELAIRALEVNLLDTRSSTRGWVEGGWGGVDTGGGDDDDGCGGGGDVYVDTVDSNFIKMLMKKG